MSVNKVTLIGHVGQDVVLRKMPNGDSTCKLTLATTEKWTDASGKKVEKTEWHRLTFFKGLADVVGKYITKGSMIYVEGRIESSTWTDKTSGQERTSTEIVCNKMEMLSIKERVSLSPLIEF